MIVWNVTQNKMVAGKIRRAGNFFQRLRGLIGTRGLSANEGLLIPKCQGIHTFGMSFPIDVVFLNKENEVIRLSADLRPNICGPVSFEAQSVLELTAGKIRNSEIQVGDKLQFLEAKPREFAYSYLDFRGH